MKKGNDRDKTVNPQQQKNEGENQLSKKTGFTKEQTTKKPHKLEKPSAANNPPNGNCLIKVLYTISWIIFKCRVPEPGTNKTTGLDFPVRKILT